MLTAHIEDDQTGKGEHYGYGLDLRANGFGHGGAMIGTESMLVARERRAGRGGAWRPESSGARR